MSRKPKFNIPFYSASAGYVVYKRKSASPAWETVRSRAEAEARSNLLTSLGSIESNFMSKAESIGKKLISLGNQEEKKEKNLIKKVLGKSDADLKDVKVFVEKFNEMLLGQKQFLLAKKRLDTAIKLGKDKKRKDMAPTVASFFVSYLEKAISDNLNKFINTITLDEITKWNKNRLKQIIDHIIDISIDKAVEKMLNAENIVGKEAYHGEWKELLQVYQTFSSLSESFKQMIRSKLNLDSIINILKKEENRSSIKKNKQKKKGGKSVRQLVKQSMKTSDNSLKARSIGGNVEEYIMQLIKLKDMSVDIGEGKTLVKGGAVLSTEKSKTDSVTIFNLNKQLNIDTQKLAEAFVEETSSSTSLLDMSNKIDTFYKNHLEHLDDVTLIYDSTKSYSMSDSFSKSGFHGGGERRLIDAPKILSQLKFTQKKTRGFINAIFNSIDGAIFDSKQEDLIQAFKEQITGALAFLLFDDWSTIGNKKNQPNAIHVFSLEGIEVPLSVLLKAVGKAIKQSSQETQKMFNVSVKLPNQVIWKDEPINEGKLGKKIKTEDVMEEWERQKKEAQEKSTFSITFLRNFKTFIYNYINF